VRVTIITISRPPRSDQIRALYEAHAPDKVDKVDGLLEKYKGTDSRGRSSHCVATIVHQHALNQL
jgi:hypothetical protein